MPLFQPGALSGAVRLTDDRSASRCQRHSRLLEQRRETAARNCHWERSRTRVAPQRAPSHRWLPQIAPRQSPREGGAILRRRWLRGVVGRHPPGLFHPL